jgi:3-dehydroquinate synthase
MKTLPLDLGDRSYPIYIGTGLLGQPELFSRHIPGTRVAIVRVTVAPLYLARAHVASKARRGSCLIIKQCKTQSVEPNFRCAAFGTL